MPRRTEPIARGKAPVRKTGLKPGGPLPAESPKRIQSRPLRTIVRERVAERDGHRCRAAVLVPGVRCGGPLDVHEVIPRSALPGAELDERDCVLVCRCHHDWIGLHELEAAAVALHGYSWQRRALEVAAKFIANLHLCSECSDPLGLDLCLDHVGAQAHPECCPFCHPDPADVDCPRSSASWRAVTT